MPLLVTVQWVESVFVFAVANKSKRYAVLCLLSHSPSSSVSRPS